MTDKAPLYADLADGPSGGYALWLKAEDSVRIRMAVWPEGQRGTVLILPGRTEAVEKYGRAAADLARRGYASLAIDWRGQGLADRLMKNAMTGHVGRFTDYQRDLRAVMAALPGLALPGPLFLLAHSMGGAIALRSLVEGLPVQAAAFTAPMWGIRLTPAMRPLAWAIASGARAARLGFTMAPGTDITNYMAVAPFEGNLLTTDPDMFAWMKRQVVAQPALSLGGPSLAWAHEALLECRRLRAMATPRLPAVTFLGTAEKIVDVAAIHDRMRRWPGGSLDVVAGAEHEVLMEIPATRAHAYDQMVAMFEANR